MSDTALCHGSLTAESGKGDRHLLGEAPGGPFRKRCLSLSAAEKPTAPNLTNFASREWLAGLLDPKQVSGPRYFGNTKFRTGKMPQFVKETLSELDAGDKANLKKVIMALSAEAMLPASGT